MEINSKGPIFSLLAAFIIRKTASLLTGVDVKGVGFYWLSVPSYRQMMTLQSRKWVACASVPSVCLTVNCF